MQSPPFPRYFVPPRSKYSPQPKVSPKALKWSIITPEEMRKFLGLIILMGQVRKESIRDYWSTDPTVSTPIFPHTLSRNHFESIWQAWHLSDISQQMQDSGWLFKIWPVYEYFVQKFRSVYSPKQELSLDEAMIPLWGHLKYPSRQCKVCAARKKRSETRYICKFCVVPLHKGSCFEKYHTVKNY